LPFAYTADDKEISCKGEQTRKTASNKDLQQLYSGAVINLKIACAVGFLIIRAVSGHNHGKLWRMSLQRKAEGHRTHKKTFTPTQGHNSPHLVKEASYTWVFITSKLGLLYLNFSARFDRFSKM